jgi:general nucleoside transport system permease protein
VTDTTVAAELHGPRPGEATPTRPRIGRLGDFLLRSILPLVLALGTGAIVLVAIGVDPIQYYKDVWSGGFQFAAWQDTAMRVAPLLLIAVGLIVVFRAGIWNLGMDGQFLLAAAVIAGIGPRLEHHLPNTINLVFLFLLAGAVGAAWTIVPALLKARYELNEIITTLMMSFIGINLAQVLVKGTFQDPSTTTPQTRAFDFAALLPSIPGTESMTRRWPGIHIGLLVALAAAVAVWFLMSRTSFGLRLQVLGASARSARHMGLDVPRLIVVAFLLSGMFVGFAAAVEILGVKGYVRADWNPAFGLWVVPLVFLARLHAIGVIPYVAALSLASIGGDYAAQNAGLTPKFTLLLVGLTLVFMALTEWIARRAELGGGYLPGASFRRRRGVEEPSG